MRDPILCFWLLLAMGHSYFQVIYCDFSVERSSDQVIKPINIDALGKWVGSIPQDVVEEMSKLAPMLQRLGYDPYANSANYGTPDGMVINNTKSIHAQQDLWLEKGKSVVAPDSEAGKMLLELAAKEAALEKEEGQNQDGET
jgi:hypothetical protein